MYTAHLARFNQLECEQALSQVHIQNLMYNMYKHLFENYVFQNPMDKCQSQWSHHVHRQDHRTPSLSCDSDRITFHHRTAYDCLEITDWLQGTLPNLKSGKCAAYMDYRGYIQFVFSKSRVLPELILFGNEMEYVKACPEIDVVDTEECDW